MGKGGRGSGQGYEAREGRGQGKGGAGAGQGAGIGELKVTRGPSCWLKKATGPKRKGSKPSSAHFL